MEIEIFTLADFAADQGNGKLTVVGTFDNLYCPQLPATHPACAVALRIRIANKEAGSHDFELKILNPDGKQFLSTIKAKMDVKVNPNADYVTLNMVFNLNNVKLEKAGKYAFEFYFDGEFRSGLKLNVVHAIPPGMVKAA
jgi:hypothetical protein